MKKKLTFFWKKKKKNSNSLFLTLVKELPRLLKSAVDFFISSTYMNASPCYQQFKAIISISSGSGFCWSESQMILPSDVFSVPELSPVLAHPLKMLRAACFPILFYCWTHRVNLTQQEVFKRFVSIVKNEELTLLMGGRSVTSLKKREKKSRRKFQCINSCLASIRPWHRLQVFKHLSLVYLLLG